VVSSSPPEGWYPDPENRTRMRWWDGTDWTDHTGPTERPWQPFSPKDLIVSQQEARMLLIGDGLFFGGLILFFGGSALWPGASLAYWTALMVPGMAGVLVLIELGRRVARRLRPERIGPFGRWLLEAELGQHWLRPSVLRRALHLVR
jgi:hypothetical protein